MSDASKTISAVFWLVMILIWIASSVAKAKRSAAARPKRGDWQDEPGLAPRPAGQADGEVVFEAQTEDVASFLREVSGTQQRPVQVAPQPPPMPQPQPYFAPPPQPAEPSPYFAAAPEPPPVELPPQPAYEVPRPAPRRRPARRAASAYHIDAEPAARVSLAGQFGAEDMRRNMVLIEVLGRPRSLRQWADSPSWDPMS